MKIQGMLACAAAAGFGAMAGWLAHPEAIAVLPTAQAPMPAREAAAPQSHAPLIAVARDGNVTLRVEQQPLDWVLDQIALQSGWSDVRERAGLPARPGGPSAAPEDPAASSVHDDGSLRAETTRTQGSGSQGL